MKNVDWRRGNLAVLAAVLVWGVVALAAERSEPDVDHWMEVSVGGPAPKPMAVPSPASMTINGGEFLAGGHLLARFGGLLNDVNGKRSGKSYLEVCVPPDKTPFLACQSGDGDGGFPVFNAAFDADGHRAVFSAIQWDNPPHSKLSVADFKDDGSGVIMPLDAPDTWVTTVAISRDGKVAASCTNTAEVALWDLVQQKKTGTLNVESAAGVMALDSKGQRLVLGATYGGDSGVQIWDVAAQKRLARCMGHTGNIIAAAVSPDDAVAATSDADGAVWLWALPGGEGLWRVECGGGAVHKLRFSADGTQLLTVAEETAGQADKPYLRKNQMRVWDVATARPLVKFESVDFTVTAATFSEDGKNIVTYQPGAVRHWAIPIDLPKPKTKDPAAAPVQPTDGQIASFDCGAAWTVGFTPDGKTVICGGMKGIQSWDIATHKAGDSFPEARLFHILNTEHDLGVDEGLNGGGATVMALSTGKSLEAIKSAKIRYTDALALSADGKLLAWADGAPMERVAPGSTPQLEVFHVADGSSIFAVSRNVASVRCLAFAPDGKLLYMATGWRSDKLEDAVVHALDGRTGAETAALSGLVEVPKEMVVSKDGRRIWVLGDAGTVQGFDAETGKEAARSGQLGQAFSLAVSPDGTMVAAGLYNNNIVLLDAATGKVIRRLRRHQGLVMGLAFSADSTRLASVSQDKTVRLWDVGKNVVGR